MQEKDAYGNEVTRMARPLPVEYLLVDVPVSTPLEPVFKFYVGKENLFPVENRFNLISFYLFIYSFIKYIFDRLKCEIFKKKN